MATASFSVLTFNILGAWDQREGAGWDRRRDSVIRTIRLADADLVGIQEGTRGQLEDLDAGLAGLRRAPVHDPVEPAVPQDEDPLNAIYYRPNRFRYEKGGVFWLGEDPTRPAQDWDAAFPRCAAWARLVDVRGGEPLIFVSTHLDNWSQQARMEGVSLILNFLRQHDGDADGPVPAIAVGDFNSDASLEVHRRFLDGPPAFRDAWEQTHAGPGAPYSDGTFHDFTGKPLLQVGRIDWILYTGPLDPLAARIIDESFDGAYPSDHFPVLTSFIRP
jgi:endonuclease/exonuclease/phosphatase family metal-dependent hydrolase